MASSGKWEVVGKSNKKRNNFDRKKDKPKLNGAPSIEVPNPVSQDETIYQAFDIHDKKRAAAGNTPFNPYEKNSDDESGKVQETKKPIVKKKPQGKQQQKTENESLIEALQKVNLTELKDILGKDEASFPSNPSLWLKDLASYLHLKLQNVPEKDLVFEDLPKEYPTCLLRDDMKSFLVKTLKSSSSTTLSLFFEYLMNEMVQELSRGHSVYGMQLMIQLTMNVSPAVAMDKLEEYREMLDCRKSRPKEALSIMWALGQLPTDNLDQGIEIWTRIMMPMTHYKQLARFSVNYLDNVLKMPCTSNQKNLIGCQDFFNILALTLDSLSPLAGNHSLKRKMVSLYPKLKALSFSSNPSTNGRNYFLTLLHYLKCSNELPLDYRTEVLDCLIFCLQNDPECFNIWMEVYPTSLVESSALIYYIVDTWSTRSAKVPKDKFGKLISTFQVFNRQQDKAKNITGYEDCVMACHVAEGKCQSRSSIFSIRRLFKLVIIVLVGVVAVDLYKHKGYQGSKTSRYAKEYGIEQGAIRVHGHVKNGLDKGNSWIQENYPAYYSQFREYADPAAKYTKDKLSIAYNFVAEQTQPARKYLSKKIPEVLEKIETEVPKYWSVVSNKAQHYWDIYWPIIHHYLVIIQETFLKYVPPLINKLHEMLTTLANRIYELAPEFFDRIIAWLEGVGQSITEKVPDFVAVVQEYAIIASKLIVNLVNNAITWIQSLANSGDTVDDVVTKQTTSKSFPK